MDKIDVLVVDDSALMRKMISEILASHPFINPKDTAINGKVALSKIQKNNYDVILLDIEMPEMDGIQFLEEYSKTGKDIPVIILSSFAKRGAEITIKALSLGAKDFITKPSGPISLDIAKVKNEIFEKVLVWGLKKSPKSEVLVEIDQSLRIVESTPVVFENPPISEVISKKAIKPKFIAIGISTGGPPAIRKLLSEIDKDFPLGIVIAQHMPEFFTLEFAKSLANSYPHLTIVEAKDFELISPGKVIIAKGGKHLVVHSSENKYFARVVEDSRFLFRPSVDLLFESIAENVGRDVIGIVMTGMGSDGAKGLKKLHEIGAITIAQGEKSSTIFGMPKSAIKAGAVDFVWEIEDMVKNIKHILSLLL
ncbi:MAG: chemotaxis-specific protein-glutamate methyltransferase CheB [Brevinematia bacterium]